jgi:hypothetical protein
MTHRFGDESWRPGIPRYFKRASCRPAELEELVRRILVVLPLILVLSACGPSADEETAPYRAQVQAKLKLIEACTRHAMAYSGELKAPGVGDLQFGMSSAAPAEIIQLEMLDQASRQIPLLNLALNDFWLEVPTKVAAGTSLGSAQAAYMSAIVRSFLSLKHLAIVRTRSYAESGGAWAADVLLYEVESGSLLGGWSVAAKFAGTAATSESDWTGRSLTEPQANARKALHDALLPFCDENASIIN